MKNVPDNPEIVFLADDARGFADWSTPTIEGEECSGDITPDWHLIWPKIMSEEAKSNSPSMSHSVEAAPNLDKLFLGIEQAEPFERARAAIQEAIDLQRKHSTAPVPSLTFPREGPPVESRACDHLVKPPQVMKAPLIFASEARPISEPKRLRRFLVCSIAGFMIAASFGGMFFRQEVNTYVAAYATHQGLQSTGRSQKLNVLTNGAGLVNGMEDEREAAQQTPEASESDSRQNGWKDRELAEIHELAGSERQHRDPLVAEADAQRATSDLRQSLQQQHDRADGLAIELAKARRDYMTQLGLAGRTREEAEQLKLTAERAAAELQRSLQTERDRAASLAGDLARAQQDITARARREIEMQEAQTLKMDDEVARAKLIAERSTAELQQSLKMEKDRAERLAAELARAQQDIETQVEALNKAKDEAAQMRLAATDTTAQLKQLKTEKAAELSQIKPAMKTSLSSTTTTSLTGQVGPEATAKQVAATTPGSGSPEAMRLLMRARVLLSQGNIGEARTVLERAAEMGDAEAIFALAETYDPLVLSTWRTYGTRGDATKARELYAKAHAGGILYAKDRYDALLPDPDAAAKRANNTD